MVVVDESLLHLLDSIHYDFEHVIVVSQSGSSPAGTIEVRIAHRLRQSRMSWPAIQERQAAAMCYTSGTTGRPKGVIYSHRALVLHSLVFALPNALGISSRDVILPAVPMFHVNGWNLPFTAALTRRKVGAARPSPGSRQFAGPARGRAGDIHGRSADRVDGGPAGASMQSQSDGTFGRCRR